MYQETRPTCVTVIGWVWILIGAFMCLSAIMTLFSSVMIDDSALDNSDIPFILQNLPLIAFIKLCAAVLGIASGFHFLKLRLWARNVLEGLCWTFLIFLVVSMVSWSFKWISVTSGDGSRLSDITGVVMSIVVTAVYSAPLVIMIKYLRGDEIKNAILDFAEESLK